MGCDIHGWVERSTEEGWVAVVPLHDDSRNYKRFAALADVRNHESSGIEGQKPKGIPEDVSETTKYHIDEWGNDGHSHSYLSLEEAVHIFVGGKEARRNHLWKYFDIYLEPDEIGQFRLVFWFDN